jgi:hypothetical protein
VILHERDIRKDIGAFAFLKSRGSKADFLDELTQIVADMPFTLICSVIRKAALKQRYSNPENPYHVALGFGWSACTPVCRRGARACPRRMSW